MRHRVVRAAPIIVLLLAMRPALAQEPEAAPEEPRRTDLVETTERRLMQIDVTVKGPREEIANLSADDFRLVIGTQKVEDFTVDNTCVLPERAPVQQVEVEVEEGARAQVPRRPRTNFLFYFDQHHLTMAGRALANSIAMDLIPEVIVDGNRGMIVSAGQDLRTFSELTDDPDQLLEAMQTLDADRRQWDPWVQQEDSRIGEIIEILNEHDSSRALAVARGHQREERWRTEKALHLFSMVLGRMSALDPPKAVIYFADTMRSNAGAHYLSFFSRAVEGSDADASGFQAFDARHAFDRVLEEATAMGIRVFTVEARGLMTTPNRSIAAEAPMGASSVSANTQPVKDAQDSLVSLAAESGGRAFLNGVRGKKIAAQIMEDLSCVYLISFDATHLKQNTVHRVSVESNRPGIRVRARGQLTVQSESRRLTSRLMAAFASPTTGHAPSDLEAVLIPTGFANGKYSALVQLRAPGSALPAASWDLGLSLISGGEVAEDSSGHISTGGPGVPVMLEARMQFRPGPFRLVAVAHETTGNEVSTTEVEASWPDPNDASVTLGPIAAMQPGAAAILRDEQLRREGAIGLPDGGVARADRPLALIGIVCRAKGNKGRLRVERKLLGDADSFAPFGPMELDLTADRCAQTRDFIPAGSMSSGMFTYEIHVFDKNEEVASGSRTFAAASADEHPGLASTARP